MSQVRWHPYDSDTALKTVGRDIAEVETPNHGNVHYPVVEDFVSAILDDRDPRVTPAEAAKTNRLLDALYLSAQENHEVRIDEID